MIEKKFRAWFELEGQERMLEGIDITKKIRWEFKLKNIPVNGFSKYTCYVDGSQLILMQYTGLKDKKGVKIYEGDIVKITCGDNVPNQYTADMFELRNTINDFGGVIEVIGNIYENPELLEVDK